MIERRPSSLTAARVFLLSLGVLLLGYMFLGRGFAHVGVPPLFVGEVVLVIGLVCTTIVLVRTWPPRRPSVVVALLLAFMVLGALRTIPYLPQYGVVALRDAVLWGYGIFALMLYVLADRDVISRALRGFGWIVPIFAAWLPISWTLFGILSREIDPTRPGDVIPLVFFKSGDMTVHIVGVIAFLVIVPALMTRSTFWWRALVAVPLIWTLLVAGTSSRAAMVAAAFGIGTIILLARNRRWQPLLVGGVVAMLIFTIPTAPVGVVPPSPTPTHTPVATQPERTPRPTPTASPVVVEPSPGRRQVEIGQLFDNLVSIIGSTSNAALDGPRAFRLAWWSEIVEYTVFGEYFWTGKGFGVNLANDDGFQPTADQSMRAPHNSHMSILARMGVPGFVLWILLQIGFFVALLRAIVSHRRGGDTLLAAAGALVLVYWVAIMINTSFDPYIEGPQGGIWYWSVFGLGLVIARLAPTRHAPA
jgi:hypothetical protein